ncbi:protein of unknown function [Taphrina deformans PYCC 5710]|uniref:Uncharacterized protein n=1 Tax=Taphrina deformans (strain PYCC 5710 / ATCC 11124 / CBS 356.35 / IMI 108563 / JCM 9778 / NBRC 8474) TaxID=1097556 RepID=R4XGQ6_TAPDE|nr:protein of unknown function [Taphrina deformans PYCC 5710]|eukprot:CCG83662.1 protein of unknown function [Taphrina deformans PYCC 5710]
MCDKQGGTHIPQVIRKTWSAPCSDNSRHFHGHLSEDHLAIALGLSSIEMIASEESEFAKDSRASKLNKAVLEAYDASFSKPDPEISCFSDAGDSHTSLGLTHASSHSSPSSVSGYPSPLAPTYAQVSSGVVDSGLRSPPHLSLNSVTDDTGTVSSHFAVLSNPSQESTPKRKETALGFSTPVTYASKVSSGSPPISSPTSQVVKSSRPYEPFVTVQTKPRARNTKPSMAR